MPSEMPAVMVPVREVAAAILDSPSAAPFVVLFGIPATARFIAGLMRQENKLGGQRVADALDEIASEWADAPTIEGIVRDDRWRP
ncbi:MAG: hypothetical protein ACE5HE_13490 [Phycisphaerae bacterium]